MKCSARLETDSMQGTLGFPLRVRENNCYIQLQPQTTQGGQHQGLPWVMLWESRAFTQRQQRGGSEQQGCTPQTDRVV